MSGGVSRAPSGGFSGGGMSRAPSSAFSGSRGGFGGGTVNRGSFNNGFNRGSFNNGFNRGFVGNGFNRFNGNRFFSRPFVGFGFGFGYPFYGYPYYGYGYGYPGYYTDGYYPYDSGYYADPYAYNSYGNYGPSYGQSGYYGDGSDYPQQQQPPVVINQNLGNPTPPIPGTGTESFYRRPDYYLIAFADHSIQAALTYRIEGDQIIWTTREHEERRAPLSSVDRRFTEQMNRDRHVEMRLQ